VRPIVLLAPTLAPHLWSKIAFFPEVYYVQGSALEVVSLRRAGIATAEKAVLLAKPHKPFVCFVHREGVTQPTHCLGY